MCTVCLARSRLYHTMSIEGGLSVAGNYECSLAGFEMRRFTIRKPKKKFYTFSGKFKRPTAEAIAYMHVF